MTTHDPLVLTLGMASELACIERHYLSALFRKHVGMSFIEWRRWIRTRRAACLIVAGALSVDEVVQAVGYKDRRSLERALKELFGLTPRELQRDSAREGAPPGEAPLVPERAAR